MERAGRIARMEERRGAYRGFVGRPEGKRPLVRPGRRWQLYIKVYLFEKWDGGVMGWVDLAQKMDRPRTFVNAVMNLQIP